MAKIDETATETTETAAAPAAPKAPVNPQVPAQYKEPTTGKYLPGHDAKHKSAVVAAVLAGGNKDKLFAELGSDKLREGAEKQLENAIARRSTKGTEGEVIIKGESHDARKTRTYVAYDAGEKGWVEVAIDSRIASTFKSRRVIDQEAAAAAKAAEATEAAE